MSFFITEAQRLSLSSQGGSRFHFRSCFSTELGNRGEQLMTTTTTMTTLAYYLVGVIVIFSLFFFFPYIFILLYLFRSSFFSFVFFCFVLFRPRLLGGVAGGKKYIWRGILFKLADGSSGPYCGNDEAAAKGMLVKLHSYVIHVNIDYPP